MKRFLLAALCGALLLCSCTFAIAEVLSESVSEPAPAPESAAPAGDESGEEEVGEEEPGIATVYVPDESLGPEETVEAYFEQLYYSYISFSDIDLSSIVDMEQRTNRTAEVWMQLHNQRRRLIRENGYCYVEAEMYPYTITYIEEEELADPRMATIREQALIPEENLILHLVLTGEPGRAYPPMMAMNTQHTFGLRQVAGEWKITYQYFTGSHRKFGRYNFLKTYTDEEVLAQLEEEFAAFSSPPGAAIPPGAKRYDGSLAAGYALTYGETPNEAFYNVGDWMGNCMNFVSQCVWFGFGDGSMPSIYGGENMSSNWYGGEGGGNSAWENVEYFWEEITRPGGLSGTELEGITALREGDIIQTMARIGTADERFSHTLIVVDADTLLLAQNSPACFVYYSDLVNVYTRFVRPDYVQ